MSESLPPRQQKKRGPISHGYARGNIVLPPALLDWAKSQPEGLSGLVRQLLTAERQRRERRQSASP